MPTTNVKAKRPGGTERPLSDHSDQPSASEETEARWANVIIRPDEYDLTAYTNYNGNTTPASNTETQLVLPEPWRPEDLAANGGNISQSDLLNRTPFANNGITDADGLGIIPSFWIDYENHPPVIPTALQDGIGGQNGHVRPSVATRWDSNGDLVEVSAGEPRLQRDPKTGDVLGLLYEPKRTQILSSPQDLTTANWTKDSVNTSPNVGSAKNENYDSLTEDSSDASHRIYELIPRQTEGEPAAASAIVKPNGRNWCALEIRLNDDDAPNNSFEILWFDISNGVTGTTSISSNSSIITHAIEDLGNGWYRVKAVLSPDSAYAFDGYFLRLANGDGALGYQGDGSSGIYVMHAQAEVSREVTTPILTGGGVREADEVDYRFNFPDKTTGVAYSILDENSSINIPFATSKFGTTSAPGDIEHGVLMDRGGLNDNNADGYKQVTRNSDNTDSGGNLPEDETIDRFQHKAATPPDAPIRLYRQIAIHTAPHTDTQLSDLKSNYLTQP
jgi:hypothetical protein